MSITSSNRRRDDATATIANVRDATEADPQTGAVTSIQAADMTMSADAVEQLFSAIQLERLARTYWRFLARITLGLVHVHYTERERFVVLVCRAFKLITFSAPEYELDGARALVRWRIERGLLVARHGRGGRGHLQIELQRLDAPAGDRATGRRERVHVEVEVANFYPAIAFGLSKALYNATQSRIHVLVTSAFLRSLSRLDFPRSKVGRFDPSRSDGRRPRRAAWRGRGGR
jgi:hypothetical protein